jgi:hypothetical protein
MIPLPVNLSIRPPVHNLLIFGFLAFSRVFLEASGLM